MSDCKTCKHKNKDDKSYKCEVCYWGDMYESKYEVSGCWTPCSVELPKKEGCYFLTMRTESGIRYTREGMLYSNGKFTNHDKVVAWMPMFEPYQGE